MIKESLTNIEQVDKSKLATPTFCGQLICSAAALRAADFVLSGAYCDKDKIILELFYKNRLDFQFAKKYLESIPDATEFVVYNLAENWYGR